MKRTVTFYDFERAFVEHERKDSFSRAGLRALFEWIEAMEEDTGEETELDAIGLCGEFTEYSLADYNEDYDPVNSLDEVEDKTIVIRIPGSAGFIIQNF